MFRSGTQEQRKQRNAHKELSKLPVYFGLCVDSFFGLSNANAPLTCPQNDFNRTSVRPFNVKCFKVGYRCTQNLISDATFNVWSYCNDGGDGNGYENVKGSSDPTATLFLSLTRG